MKRTIVLDAALTFHDNSQVNHASSVKLWCLHGGDCSIKLLLALKTQTVIGQLL